MFVPLPRDFFAPSSQVVAPLLLGHYLLRRTATGYTGGIIVETEAYITGDPSAHSFRGKTPRNSAMFGPPGHAYVYFIYGFHYCVNAACLPEGRGEAVLIRALEPTVDLADMHRRRPVAQPRDLTNGPAKLCAALGIDRAHDGVDLCDPTSPLIIAANDAFDEYREAHGPLLTTPRIGITQAADWPLRFVLAGSAFASRRVGKPAKTR